MALEPVDFIIAVGLTFTYFIVQKHSRFIAGIFYVLIGLGWSYHSTSLAHPQDIHVGTMVGVLIVLYGAYMAITTFVGLVK